MYYVAVVVAPLSHPGPQVFDELAGIVAAGLVPLFVRRTAALRFHCRASLNERWHDDLNHLLLVRIGGVVAKGAKAFEERVVDGVVNALGRLTVAAGDRLRVSQTGRVQNHAPGIATGLIAMAGGDLRRATR